MAHMMAKKGSVQKKLFTKLKQRGKIEKALILFNYLNVSHPKKEIKAPTSARSSIAY
jgi:hypothetical protein